MSSKRIHQKLKFKADFQKVIDDLNKNNLKFFIAGGAVLSAILKQEINQDLDIFFRTLEDYNKAKKYFDPLCATKYESDNAITFIDYKVNKHKNRNRFDQISIKDNCTIQIIKKSFGAPEEIISNFDLNKSMIAYENDKVIIDDRFLEPIYIVSKNIKSLDRLMKYSERLYNFQRDNHKFKVMHEIDWNRVIKDFDTPELIPDFYVKGKTPANVSLKNFLKNIFTDITKREYISDIEIKKVLDKMEIEKAYDLVKDAFISINYVPKYYFEKVAYFKFNSKKPQLASSEKYKDKIKDCMNTIKNRNPEMLFG